MKIRGERSRLNGEENIVPMINVVFLLLIFFLLAGTLAPRPPFPLDPVATTLRPPGDAPVDGLYVSASGELFFQGERVSLETLPAAVRSHPSGSGDTLDVVVDRRLTGAALFPIMEGLSKSGLTKVRLITERSMGG